MDKSIILLTIVNFFFKLYNISACLKYAQEEPALRRTGPPVKLSDGSDYLDEKCHPPVST